jgi:class 3 adenylate cyclase
MHSKQDFLNARFDFLRIFLSAFLIHSTGIALVFIYVALAFDVVMVLHTLRLTIPAVLTGISISFLLFCYLHKHLIRYFFYSPKNNNYSPGIEKERLQKELLNFPLIAIAAFVIWVLTGIVLSFFLLKTQTISLKEAFVHIGFASLFSGSLVAILQLNVTENIIQRKLLPYFLTGTRISDLSGIIKIPTYARIQLLVFTTAIGPAIFIYLLYVFDEMKDELLLFNLAFMVFNGVWQGGFLLRNISQPIGQIAGKLQRFRRGELEKDIKPVWRTDALGQFSEMFDDLVKSIQERDYIRSTFSRYLDPILVNEVLSGRHELGGGEIEASVMFADIRGFTHLSETLDAQAVVTLLNNYFEEMVQEITFYNGIPDKFLGDGLLAVWGVPGGTVDHGLKACQAAIAMLKRLELINEKRIAMKLSPINIGIGIHSGKLIAGNIGSKKKMEYTVIGDTVNTSSRIEGMCKTLDVALTISEVVYRHLPETHQPLFVSVGKIQLRGKSKDIELFVFKPE